MTKEERIKAAEKFADKFVHEDDKRNAKLAFMAGCEFEGQGEIIKGELLEVEYEGGQAIDGCIIEQTDGAGLMPNGYLDFELYDSINPNIFKAGDNDPDAIEKNVEKPDYSGLTDFERAIHRGFLCAGVENVPVDIIKETAQDCMAHIEPAEWGEEDENALEYIHELISFGYSKNYMDAQTTCDMREWVNNHLCPRPHWKPSIVK